MPKKKDADKRDKKGGGRAAPAKDDDEVPLIAVGAPRSKRREGEAAPAAAGVGAPSAAAGTAEKPKASAGAAAAPRAAAAPTPPVDLGQMLTMLGVLRAFPPGTGAAAMSELERLMSLGSLPPSERISGALPGPGTAAAGAALDAMLFALYPKELAAITAAAQGALANNDKGGEGSASAPR